MRFRAEKPSFVPLGLVGAIALIVGVERYIAQHQNRDYTTIWAQDWLNAGRLANRSADCDFLLMGDSLIKFGMVTPRMEKRLGLKGANLASCVSQPPLAYYHLKHALARGARPKAIVLDCTEHLLSVGPRKNTRHWPEALGVAECFEVARTGNDPDLFLQLASARIAPSIKDRVEIRDAIMAAFHGMRATNLEVLGSIWRNWNVNRGAQILPQVPGALPIDDWYRAVYPPDWHCDPVNLAYLRRLLRLAEDYQVAVIWLLPPYKARLQAICQANGVEGRYEAMVRSFQERFSNVVVLDGRRATYPEESYATDPIHLNYVGAMALSDDVADVVANVLAKKVDASRWVTLPDYRPRPFDPDLEHMALSSEKLARAGAAKIRQ